MKSGRHQSSAAASGPIAPVKALRLARSFGRISTDGVDPMMHQTILAMLGLASCALILVAFWGSDLLGNKGRGQR
jgi:hypothetical protein